MLKRIHIPSNIRGNSDVLNFSPSVNSFTPSLHFDQLHPWKIITVKFAATTINSPTDDYYGEFRHQLYFPKTRSGLLLLRPCSAIGLIRRIAAAL